MDLNSINFTINYLAKYYQLIGFFEMDQSLSEQMGLKVTNLAYFLITKNFKNLNRVNIKEHKYDCIKAFKYYYQ